jgi:hypothetical protein
MGTRAAARAGRRSCVRNKGARTVFSARRALALGERRPERVLGRRTRACAPRLRRGCAREGVAHWLFAGRPTVDKRNGSWNLGTPAVGQ